MSDVAVYTGRALSPRLSRYIRLFIAARTRQGSLVPIVSTAAASVPSQYLKLGLRRSTMRTSLRALVGRGGGGSRTAGTGQMWFDSGYTLYNAATGLNLDVQGNSYWGGAEIDVWYPNGQVNQIFSTPGGALA